MSVSQNSAAVWSSRILQFRPLFALPHGIQPIRHVHLPRTCVIAFPCLAEQPTLVGGVLERCTFRLALLDEVHLVVGQLAQVHRTAPCRQTHYFEPLLSCFLLGTHWRGSVSVNARVLAPAPTAVVVTGSVLS